MPPPPALTPTLNDEVVTLRPVGLHDLDAVVEQSRDPETVRWTTVPTDYTEHDARAFVERTAAQWESGERCGWALDVDGALAGLVSHRPLGDGVVEVSFAAHPAYRGRGLMTRAVRLTAGHAFEHGAEVVLWHAMVGNFGSRKVAWRAGFHIGGPITTVRRGEAVDLWPGWLRAGEPMQPRQPWLEPPTLAGDGVRLRPLREQDAERFPQEHDELVAQFAAGLPTRDGFGAWLVDVRTRAAEGAALSFAVVDPDDAVLGGLDLSRLGVPLFAGSGILGFWLLPDARGRGVLGRALEVALPWALRPAQKGGLGLHRLTAGCVEDNWASATVLRRAGFAFVGTEREALRSLGVPRDGLLFDLLATDDREAQRLEPGTVRVIDTERFRLRPWRDDDVPRSDEGPDDASLRFMPPRVHPDTDAYPAWLQLRRLRTQENGGLDWCIADLADDHALGNLTVFGMGSPPGRFQGEIGYWLHPPARGRGVLGETIPSLLDHAFTPLADGGLGLTRLHAATDLANLASQSVLLRAGFRETGRDRQAFRSAQGDVTDGVMFELLATDERVDRRRRALAEVTLEGTRVRLRPWRVQDVDRIVEACSDARTRHWLAGLPETYTHETALAYIERSDVHRRAGTGLWLAVADPADDSCLGAVSLMGLGGAPPHDPTSGEIGYWAHPDARGRGVMGEAVRVMVAHAFRPTEAGGVNVRRLVLRAADGNSASQHVARSAGFEQVGRGRAAEQLGDGSYVDLLDFDRVNPGWTPPPG